MTTLGAGDDLFSKVQTKPEFCDVCFIFRSKSAPNLAEIANAAQDLASSPGPAPDGGDAAPGSIATRLRRSTSVVSESARKLYAHRAVLLLNAPSFSDLFGNSYAMSDTAEMQRIAVDSFPYEVFRSLLFFMYNGRLPSDFALLSAEQMILLLEAADHFEQTRLRSAIALELVRDLDETTWATALKAAIKFKLAGLFRECSRFFWLQYDDHYDWARQEVMLLPLSLRTVTTLIKDCPYDWVDELHILDMVIRWGHLQYKYPGGGTNNEWITWNKYSHRRQEAGAKDKIVKKSKLSIEGRLQKRLEEMQDAERQSLKETLKPLFELMKWHKIEPDILAFVVEPYSLIPSEFMLEAYRFHSSRKGETNTRFEARTFNHCFSFHHTFDDNGLLYFLGTQGGKVEYQNPGRQGKRNPDGASSEEEEEGAEEAEDDLYTQKENHDNVEGSGRPRVIASREIAEKWHKPLHPGMAHIRHEDRRWIGACGVSSLQWLMFDLGETASIIPTSFSLAQASPTDQCIAMTQWELEGSPDGKRWTCLKKVTHDWKDAGEITYAFSWDVDTPEGGDSFRYIRVVSQEDGICMHVAGFEVYGDAVAPV